MSNYSVALGIFFDYTALLAGITTQCITQPAICDYLCNMGFEDGVNYGSGASSAKPWQEVTHYTNWHHPLGVQLSGYPYTATSRTGNGAIGIFLGYNLSTMSPNQRKRSVFGQPLNQAIVASKWIYGELYIQGNGPALPNLNPWYTLNIGNTDLIEMYFSTGIPNNLGIYQANPPVTAQISSVDASGVASIAPTTSSYQKVAGVFKVTQGSVDYVSIGNFRDEQISATRLTSGADYAYSLIDDVFIQELPGAGADQVLPCLVNSTTIGTGMCNPSDPDFSFYWAPQTGLSNPNSLTPVATISETQIYTLHATYRGISYTDEVKITKGVLEPRALMVCDNMAHFKIPGYDPMATYTISSSAGFEQYFYTITGADVEMTAVELDPDYKGVSWIQVTSNTGCSYTAYLIPCCGSTPNDILVRERTSQKYGSQKTISNKVIRVADYMEVDADITFSGCVFDLQTDAEIVVNSGVNVVMDNCHLKKACENAKYWDRIHLKGQNASLTLDGCIIEESLRGVFDDTPSNVIICDDTDFRDNKISFYLKGYNTVGPFNNSWLKLSGCTFNSTYFITDYQHPSSIINLSLYQPNPGGATGIGVNQHSNNYIVLHQSNGIHFGADTYTPNMFYGNAFMNDGICIFGEESTFYVRNNEFDGIMPHIVSQSGAVRIGGTVDEGNIFTNSEECVTSLLSSQIISNNSLVGDVDILNPINAPIEAEHGTNVIDNSIVDGEIYILSNSQGPKYTRVYNNTLTNSNIALYHCNPGTTEKTIVHSNSITASENITNFINLVNCPSAVVANNDVTYTGSYTVINPPTNLIQPRGIRLSNCTNATVKLNTLSRLNAGMHLNGNMTSTGGAVFSCNTFNSNQHAIYLNNASLSNQGVSSEGSDNNFNGQLSTDIVGNGAQASLWHFSSSQGNHSFFESPSTNITKNSTAGVNPCTSPPNKSSIVVSHDERSVFEIYPNPVKSTLNLKWTGVFADEFLILVDTRGKVVEKVYVTTSEESIDIAYLPSGIYIAKFKGKQARFVKQ